MAVAYAAMNAGPANIFYVFYYYHLTISFPWTILSPRAPLSPPSPSPRSGITIFCQPNGTSNIVLRQCFNAGSKPRFDGNCRKVQINRRIVSLIGPVRESWQCC